MRGTWGVLVGFSATCYVFVMTLVLDGVSKVGGEAFSRGGFTKVQRAPYYELLLLLVSSPKSKEIKQL